MCAMAMGTTSLVMEYALSLLVTLSHCHILLRRLPDELEAQRYIQL